MELREARRGTSVRRAQIVHTTFGQMGSEDIEDSSFLDRRQRFIVPVVARLNADRQFRKQLSQLQAYLDKSLQHSKQPEALLDLQADMAGLLLGAQREQKRMEREAGEVATDSEAKRTELKVLAGVCRHVQAIVRTIADGIAWRSLEYERSLIHLLSMKPQTGHMERLSAISELVGAGVYVAETGEVVLLNDLTNFLRYGDLTSIGKNAITIHEVKAGKGSAKSGRAIRQRHRAAEVIEFVQRGYTEGPDGPRRIVYLQTQPVAHLAEVSALLSRSKASGTASARLSDCLAIDVLQTTYVGKEVAAGRAISEFLNDPFEQSQNALSFDSLRLMAGFSRNVAPYSIFPFPTEDRLGIMAGSIMVITHLNFDRLIRCLRRRNLVATPPKKENMKYLEGLLPGEVAKRELDNPFMVSRSPSSKTLAFSYSSLARLSFEFLDEESFADIIEEELTIAEEMSEPTLIHNSLEREGDLWD